MGKLMVSEPTEERKNGHIIVFDIIYYYMERSVNPTGDKEICIVLYYANYIDTVNNMDYIVLANLICNAFRGGILQYLGHNPNNYINQFCGIVTDPCLWTRSTGSLCTQW